MCGGESEGEGGGGGGGERWGVGGVGGGEDVQWQQFERKLRHRALWITRRHQ